MTPRQRIFGKSRQRGFSLIEVLVSMVIASVGLMGMLSLMLKGLQANASSGWRTIAVQSAYDMADRMRADKANVGANKYKNIVTPGSASSCANDGSVDTAHVKPPATSTTCGGTTSSACDWFTTTAKLLPKGASAVCEKDGVYAVHVSWDDGKAGTTDKTFSLRFVP